MGSPRTRFLSLVFLLSSAAVLHAQGGTHFVDEVGSTGTSNYGFGRGVALSDLDGDGLLDIVCADAGEPNRFFRQKGDGTFEDANPLWGIASDDLLSWGVLAADFDNDGDDDVYFVNGGYGLDDGGPGSAQANTLLRNDIATTGVLLDVSAESGEANIVEQTFGGTALDYDRDGLLDIFTSNRLSSCTLFHNEEVGGLEFDDVSEDAGIVQYGDWRHCGSADFDLDGWPDVGVGNMTGQDLLYRNNGNGTFTDRASQAGLTTFGDNFGVVFQDFDNDGLVDIYDAKYQTNPTGPSPIYRNRGNATFQDVSANTGLIGHTDMGHDSGDLDGDGYPDLFMGTGNPAFVDFDYVYRVTPGAPGRLNIVDVSRAWGFNASGQSRMHGMGMGDWDRDGDIDVYCNNGGPSDIPATAQENFFWVNQGNNANWTALEVQGVYTNRTGVGLRAKATTTAGRDVYRTLQVGRGFSNTPDHALHFGIGTDTGIDRIELTWPSGIVQDVDEPVLGAYHQVVETGALLRGQPAVGQTFTVDVAGPAGDVVELALSAGTGQTEVDDVDGPFLLDPTSFVLLPALPLNTAGELHLPIRVPNLPVLSGQTYYAQVWIHPAGGGGTLSQRLTLTIQ